mgnify:CR=1 FL=1
MARNVSKNQDFKTLFETTGNLIKTNNYIGEFGDASRMSFKDECDDTCTNCQTFAESKPDPRRPGKRIVVIVKRCVS